ncbi:MAG: PadR family transcriptional regulator [Bryobacteraceae bacterium]
MSVLCGRGRWKAGNGLLRGNIPLALLQEAVYHTFVEVEGEHMADERIELPQGTLDLLILKALALAPLHGWAVSERLQQTSRDALQVPQGSLYPALHRLERKGWIKAHWGTSENNRRAKYYALTSSGQKRLSVEREAWRKLTVAVGHVLDAV